MKAKGMKTNKNSAKTARGMGKRTAKSSEGASSAKFAGSSKEKSPSRRPAQQGSSRPEQSRRTPERESSRGEYSRRPAQQGAPGAERSRRAPERESSRGEYSRRPAQQGASRGEYASRAPQKEFSRAEYSSNRPVSKESPRVEHARAPQKDAPRAEYYVWGRRTVESFLINLQDKSNFDHTRFEVHLIVDKTGKAPLQLKPIVDLAKALGIKLKAHQNSQENWPLAEQEGINHQRVCLKIPEYPTNDIVDALAEIQDVQKKNKTGCVGLVLDQIQDPRNFGAILRSAAFFGVSFVIYATDRQSGLTPSVLKTAAGGAFSLKLIPVVNINRALQQLKDAGAWIIGSALQENAQEMKSIATDRPFVLIMGNEEKGLRQEVMKNCDYLVKIPGGAITVDSLNVSVATGVLLAHLGGIHAAHTETAE